MKERSCIVFQAYGNEYILQECLYALLGFSRLHTPEETAGTEIWIYTDQPEWFRARTDCPLNLHFRTIDAELIRQWRGEIGFVHRVKIEVLRDFARDKPAAVIYLDTDTCFLTPVTDIFRQIQEGALYMHIREHIVQDESNPLLRKLHRFLQKNNPLTVNGKQVRVATDTAMWNAGMLGFHTRQAHLLDEILHFTDEVYRVFPKHIVEQFAFSLYFGQASPLRSSAAHILHYWNFKEMRRYLASFFSHFRDASWDELVRYSTLIQPHVPLQEMISFYRSRSCWDKLRRKSWQPAVPDWERLLKEMQ